MVFRTRSPVIAAFCFALCWLGGLETAAAEVPVSFAHQGRILDDAGEPVTDSVQMRVSLYNSAEGGAILWEDELSVRPDETGFYTITLGGDDNPIDSGVLRDEEVFLAIAIDGGEELSPRVKLHAVPFAQIAARAESVADGSVRPSSLAIDFSLDASRIGSVDWSSINDVPADLADGDDDTLGQMSCVSGQTAQFDGVDWNCADLLTYDGSDFATSGQGCPSDEVAVGIDVDGSLICAPDADTTYTAGTGLALNGTSFEVDTAYLDGAYAHNDQNCPPGSVVQGVNADGTLACDTANSRYAAYDVTINDTSTDLGDQFNALLADHRAVNVTLERNRIYTWNNSVNVGANQVLTVRGEGANNGANNIGVTIRMTQNATYTRNGTDYRNPVRVYVRTRARFTLTGVEVQESANDSRPLAPSGSDKALFSVAGDQAIFTFVQSRMTTTEHVANFAGHTYARVKFGHTFIDQASGAIRNIVAVRADSGWSFGGNGGVVSRSHTTLGNNVSFSTDSAITYLN